MLYLDENPNPVLKVSDKGRIVYSNPASECLLAKLAYQDQQDSLHLHDEYYQTCLRAIELSQPVELDVSCQGQTYICSFVPLSAEKCVMIYGVDITMQKKAKVALYKIASSRHRQLRYHGYNIAKRIFNTINQGLVISDSLGRIEYANQVFSQMIGFSPDAIAGQRLSDFIDIDDASLLEQILTLHTFGESFNFEARLSQRAGGRKHVMITTVPRVWNGKPIGVVTLITDLSERKRMEEALALARDQAQESERLKSEFVSTMSHELRTPMNSILGMSELLLDTHLTDEQREFATTVWNESNILLNIINSILDFSKIDSGRLALNEEELGLVGLVEDVIEMMSATAYEKNITLISYIDPLIPTRLRGDANRIRQVFVNLMSNAVKFTDRGQVLVRVSLQALSDTRVTVYCSIRDTGIGIPRSALHLIFEPFRQVDGSITRRHRGTGLGLVISKRLIELMGGKIGVESVEGQGSTFWFTINLERLSGQALKPLPHIPVEQEALRALVVSGNLAQGEVIEDYLQAWGVRAERAVNQRVALGLLRQTSTTQQPIYLVIVDQAFGEGYELADAIRKDEELRSISLVGLRDVSDRRGEQILHREVYDILLNKPLKQEQLFKAIYGLQTGRIRRQPNHEEISSQGNLRLSKTDALRMGRLVLLVENNLSNQKIALIQLQKLGYAAVAVKNGEEAIDAVQWVLQSGKAYGLILMDVEMPELDGLSASQKIRAMENTYNAHMPIVAMSTLRNIKDIERYLSSGVDAYINKPLKMSELKSILMRWLK